MTTTTLRPRGRHSRRAPRRIAACIAIVLAILGGLTVELTRPTPAAAYTMEQRDDRFVVTSKRMHANTIYMTVILTLFYSGNWEFRIEGKNTAIISKYYDVAVGLQHIYGGGDHPSIDSCRHVHDRPFLSV